MRAAGNPAPAKLNKKRQKQGKPLLNEYKTLKLILPKKSKSKGVEANDANGQRETRLHMCSGHFRLYTSEAPLFGKITGRFWIPAHMRGNKDLGEIKKSYNVKIH